MKISFSTISDAGPRPVNEDSLACWIANSGETVACIADGLGGMRGGDIASQLAVNTFQCYLKEHAVNKKTMIAAAYTAHHKIREMQLSNNKYYKMATTLTATALSEKGILGIHCGDSRAMITRGHGIKKLTKDHSEGQRLFAAGRLSKSELISYERKHILESALGDQEEPQIDSFCFDLFPKDHVLLTTDGVHNLILLHEMRRLSSNSLTPLELTTRVTETIKKRQPIDNYSMIAIYVE